MIMNIIFLLSATMVMSQETFNTPDIKVAQYIKDDLSFYSECSSSLMATLQGQADPRFVESDQSIDTACLALLASANRDPPGSFPPGIPGSILWDEWRNSREYRGYTHVPTFQLTCNNLQLTSFALPMDPQYVDDQNPTSKPNDIPTVDQGRSPYGYTKIPVEGLYDPADVYAVPYNGLSWSSNDSCLEVLDRRASRIAISERDSQFNSILPNTDAPFVFREVQLQFCCTQSCLGTIVRIARSTFPTTHLYIDDNTAGEAPQGQLGQFIASAGYIASFGDLSTPGNGVLAPEGDALTWNGCVTVAPTPSPSALQ